MQLDETTIAPQWWHPYLAGNNQGSLSKSELKAFAYDYYLRFLPFFRHQEEGSIRPGIIIDFTKRMKNRLGSADLFRQKISLNETYFRKDPTLLPYTLFHEMVHMWLYDCLYDPGHTKRFYRKMAQFETSGLPVDPDVHIHKRLANESRYVYVCDGCGHRWFVNDHRGKKLYCGHCYDRSGDHVFPKPYLNRAHVSKSDIRTARLQVLDHSSVQ